MKKISKLVTKQVEEVFGYQAEDGMVFESEYECRKHEEQIRIEQSCQRILQIPHSRVDVCMLFPEGYGDEQYVVFEPRDESDIEALCEFDCRFDATQFASGKPQVFLFIYGGFSTVLGKEVFNMDHTDDIYHCGDIDEFFGDIVSNIMQHRDRMLAEVRNGMEKKNA